MNCELCHYSFDSEDDPAAPLRARVPLYFTCCKRSPCLRCTDEHHQKERDAAIRSQSLVSASSPSLTCPCCDDPFVYDPRVHNYHGYALNKAMINKLKDMAGPAKAPVLPDPLALPPLPGAMQQHINAALPAGPQPPRMCGVCRTAPATTLCVSCSQARRPALCCATHSTCGCPERYSLAQQQSTISALDRHCTGKIGQLNTCRGELTAELAGLRGRSAILHERMNELYNSAMTSLRRLHDAVPRQLDHLVEERTRQIDLALGHLDGLGSLYQRIQHPLAMASLIRDSMHHELTLQRSQYLLATLEEAPDLAELSTAQPPPPINNGTTQDTLCGMEQMFSKLIQQYEEDTAATFRILQAKLDDLTTKVPHEDERMERLLEAFGRAEFAPVVPARSSPVPVSPAPSSPVDRVPRSDSAPLVLPNTGMPAAPGSTGTVDGVTMTREGPSSVLSNLRYAQVSSYSVNIPPAHAVVNSPVASGVGLLSYEPTSRIVLHRDLVDGKFVQPHPSGRIDVLTLIQTQYVHTSHDDHQAKYTIFITPPHILRLHNKREYINFTHHEPLRQIVEIVPSGLVIGLANETIVVAITRDPAVSAQVSFSAAYNLKPFAAAQTVLAVYKHYLLVLCGHQYTTCLLRTYNSHGGAGALCDIKGWTEDRAPHNQIVDCCVDEVNQLIYILSTTGQVSVNVLQIQQNNLVIVHDARATAELSKYLKPGVSRIHCLTKGSASLFYVVGTTPTELYEVKGAVAPA